MIQARPFGDVFLPLRRSNEGLSNDAAYVRSAIDQVQEVARHCPLVPASSVLDFGCGQGRFANGLVAGPVSIGCYLGIDTDAESISWCESWIQRFHPNFQFLHVPARNERYNPSADPRTPLPVEAGSFDVAFINSVFSHMLEPDVAFYLGQLSRALGAGGVAYMTAFVEPGVPPVEENPAGYLDKASKGRLHRVRYEQSFFRALVEGAGFTVEAFEHRGIARTGQSVIIARRHARRH